jgi:hypothetical protein
MLSTNAFIRVTLFRCAMSLSNFEVHAPTESTPEMRSHNASSCSGLSWTNLQGAPRNFGNSIQTPFVGQGLEVDVQRDVGAIAFEYRLGSASEALL